MIDPTLHWTLWHQIEHYSGTDNGAFFWYLFWSGIGAFLVLTGAVWGVVKKHNCHVHKCWHIGIHPVHGTGYIVCKKHHPDTPDGHITAEHVAQAQQDHRDRLTAAGNSDTVEP